jgi:hypothetical protein
MFAAALQRQIRRTARRAVRTELYSDHEKET